MNLFELIRNRVLSLVDDKKIKSLTFIQEVDYYVVKYNQGIQSFGVYVGGKSLVFSEKKILRAFKETTEIDCDHINEITVDFEEFFDTEKDVLFEPRIKVENLTTSKDIVFDNTENDFDLTIRNIIPTKNISIDYRTVNGFCLDIRGDKNLELSFCKDTSVSRIYLRAQSKASVTLNSGIVVHGITDQSNTSWENKKIIFNSVVCHNNFLDNHLRNTRNFRLVLNNCSLMASSISNYDIERTDLFSCVLHLYQNEISIKMVKKQNVTIDNLRILGKGAYTAYINLNFSDVVIDNFEKVVFRKVDGLVDSFIDNGELVFNRVRRVDMCFGFVNSIKFGIETMTVENMNANKIHTEKTILLKNHSYVDRDGEIIFGDFHTTADKFNFIMDNIEDIKKLKSLSEILKVDMLTVVDSFKKFNTKQIH